jgi:hypothetical protein
MQGSEGYICSRIRAGVHKWTTVAQDCLSGFGRVRDHALVFAVLRVLMEETRPGPQPLRNLLPRVVRVC